MLSSRAKRHPGRVLYRLREATALLGLCAASACQNDAAPKVTLSSRQDDGAPSSASARAARGRPLAPPPAAVPAPAPTPPPPPKAPAAPPARPLADFIPAGHEILQAVSADLNADGRSDRVVVLRRNDEQARSEAEGEVILRPLLVLMGRAHELFVLAARSDRAVLCHACGGMLGDPFEGVRVEARQIHIAHSGGSALRWSKEAVFQYDPGRERWLLRELTEATFHATDSDDRASTTQTPRDFGQVFLEDYAASG